MARLLSRIQLRFQARILIPVISTMVLLIVLTVWLVNHRISEQLKREAAERLATADAIFVNSCKIRGRTALDRYRNVPNEPRFKAVAQLGDPKTLRYSLSELLEEHRDDFALFTSAQDQPPVTAVRDTSFNPPDLNAACASGIGLALDGHSNAETISLANRLFDVVAVPVKVGDTVIGALAVGIEITQDVAEKEFRQLTHAEILFLIDNQISVSTLRAPDLHRDWTSRVHCPGDRVEPIVVDNEHYLYRLGQLPGADERINYALLSSYEKSLQALAATHRQLSLVGLIAVLVSTCLLWQWIRRATQPLRELRDSAEAVGRGDFSQRVQVRSEDECGELACVFNQMVDNLKTSREELESTLQRLKATQAQLIQSEKLAGVGEFVAGVTHELNNPLTSVIGFAELLQKNNTNTQHARHLDLIVNGAQRCHKIVQGLLSFARQHKPERKLVQLHNVLDATVGILAYQLRTSNIKVITQFDPALPLVLADSGIL